MVSDTAGAAFVKVIFDSRTGRVGAGTVTSGRTGAGTGAGGAGVGDGDGDGDGAGSSTVIPKSVARPASPEAYP